MDTGHSLSGRRLFWGATVALLFIFSISSPRAAGKPPPQKTASAAVTVYENQPLVTDKELSAFLEILPLFRSWTGENREDTPTVGLRNGKADFFYSPKAEAWVKTRGWKPERFFCVMGRMAAALVIVEEGNDMSGTRPPDMPAVAEKELELVRRHLGAILKALNSAGDNGALINR
jgi:hypothetical protein